MLTKELAIKLHREIWDWLYHNPMEQKSDWPGWGGNGGIYDFEAFDGGGCAACKWVCDNDLSCPEQCLFDWDDGEYVGGCCVVWNSVGRTLPGFFERWEKVASRATKKKYAKIIRDLPLNKGVENIV